jgi:Uma2 family endonuclease
MVKAPPRTMYEVYMGLPEGTSCQLINDHLIMSPSPLDAHQKILIHLASKILTHVEKNELGEVRVAPYDVHLSKVNIFQPDIIFVSTEHAHLIENNGLHGAPDLVVELLSQRTRKYDLEDKKDLYEQYGVKEYFMIEPSNKEVTSFMLNDRKFVQMEAREGVIASNLLQTEFSF